ncbi:uncharacterized protein LOC116341326 [Contarinia nasturtii]|uniref:uncharacterized protein LOC116341326 n=1 Tax=Contarinia nasturtii TaxID=265458 RepID=UPI0012D3963A|nr:uncharacterized protein LOC116341326 [Contarinia nasturtii]XP_031624167.1 uncharacterized protein LOC116341326 [Contarinia nasturtii]
MAVGFFADDGDDHLNSSYHTTVITTNSATQTPLQSPVSHEYLVQAFCEALHRCSIAGSPGIQSVPPSPSCSHPNGHGEVFFPRGSNSSNGSGSSSTPSPPSTPSSNSTVIRMHDDYRSAQWSARRSVPRRRYRLTSASDEEDYEDEQPLSDYEEHMQYMAERERLQVFPGRVPPPKKRDTTNTQPRKSTDPKMWPAVAAVVVLAVGCGFLVSR